MHLKKHTTLLSTLCLVLLFQCCQPPKPGIYKNKSIPSGISSALHSINADLLAALKANNADGLELLSSQDFIDDRVQRMHIAEQISIRMRTGNYSLLYEYYIYNKVPTGMVEIHERDLGINNFDLKFNRGAKQMYVAFFTAKTAVQKWLITAYYYKYDYGWKIGSLELNPYAENGKTAPELKQYATVLLKKGYRLDASNTASLAVNCLRPCANWKYVDEEAIHSYNGQLLDTLTHYYLTPIIVPDVPTHPRIWRVTLERTPEGTFPNLNYVSTINLLDTVALKKENNAVCKNIGKVFKGIDKEKKYIYYTIYNKTKKGIPVQDHYDLRQKL
jgi:transcriptional regulator of met regulon